MAQGRTPPKTPEAQTVEAAKRLRKWLDAPTVSDAAGAAIPSSNPSAEEWGAPLPFDFGVPETPEWNLGAPFSLGSQRSAASNGGSTGSGAASRGAHRAPPKPSSTKSPEQSGA